MAVRANKSVDSYSPIKSSDVFYLRLISKKKKKKSMAFVFCVLWW